jgi:flagellar basal-body rod protein FlgB
MVQELMFEGKTNTLLGLMLDKAALSQRVLSSNVANVGTPGYQRLGVSFEEKLDKVMALTGKLKTTDPRHIPSTDWHSQLKPEVATVDDGYWNGINNVNIDQEMVDLAKNQLDFNIGVRLLSSRYTGMRTAIRGRR